MVNIFLKKNSRFFFWKRIISQVVNSLGVAEGYALKIRMGTSGHDLGHIKNVNKQMSAPYFSILSQFCRHILKNQAMLFSTTFVSASEKIGVEMKRQFLI